VTEEPEIGAALRATARGVHILRKQVMLKRATLLFTYQGASASIFARASSSFVFSIAATTVAATKRRGGKAINN
jgi:hypothetical protein